jgi:hypothetical protein
VKRITYQYLMLLALTLTVSSQATGVTILWDDSHDTDGDELSGNFSTFAATMAANGHNLIELDGAPGAITPAALGGVNAVFLWDAELALTDDEITTLQNFVASGGGLFVAWDTATNVRSNNSLLAPYGLSISGAIVSSSIVTGFVPHPITASANTIETSFGTTVSTTGGSLDLTLADGANIILAVSVGPQRVVVFGDTSTFENAGIGGTSIEKADNRALITNIANFTAIPEPSTLLLTTLATFVITWYRRRHIRCGPDLKCANKTS